MLCAHVFKMLSTRLIRGSHANMHIQSAFSKDADGPLAISSKLPIGVSECTLGQLTFNGSGLLRNSLGPPELWTTVPTKSRNTMMMSGLCRPRRKLTDGQENPTTARYATPIEKRRPREPVGQMLFKQYVAYPGAPATVIAQAAPQRARGTARNKSVASKWQITTEIVQQ